MLSSRRKLDLDLTRARRMGSGMAFWRAASWVEVYLPVLRPEMARASLSAGFIRCLGCSGGMTGVLGCLLYSRRGGNSKIGDRVWRLSDATSWFG